MLTRHHIIARQFWGSDHTDNITMLENKMHRNLHNLLDNKFPHEQINMIAEIASTALHPKFRKDLHSVLWDYTGKYYKHHTFKNGVWQ